MPLRFTIAVLILILACGFQFWFASGGIFINLLLATLITFAFFFEFWEMVVFILFGIFVINWQPAISLELFLFVLIPLAAFAGYKVFAWRQGAGVPLSIIIGSLVFYIIIAPSFLLSIGNWGGFLADLVGSLIFSELVFLALARAKRGNYH